MSLIRHYPIPSEKEFPKHNALNSGKAAKILQLWKVRRRDKIAAQERSFDLIAHVFVDAENISPAVTFKVVEYFGREHTITKVDIIAKEDTLPYRYRALDEKLYRVQNCFYGKNSADTWLCIEIVRAIIDEPDLELIIIVSSDKDFLPAIKFAVDFEKKVFVVSNGAGHRALAEQLRSLQVDSDSVELKDFRLKFGDVPTKLEKFLPRLTFYTKKFFFDREERIKFILVRQGSQILEVPFVAGMNLYTFGRVLHELNILTGNDSVRNFVAQNFLKIFRNKVYFRTEAEISVPTPAEQVERFFIEHADDVRKVFIKHNGKFFEVSFVDGMPLEIFGQMLRDKKIIGKGASPAQTAMNSLLDVHDGKVFLHAEENLDVAYENTIKDIGEYFGRHEAELRKIFIKHNQKIFEVPFVDGMPLELFGKLLREKNIIGKSTSATNVAKKSFLDVRDGKIFLCDEDRLNELYAEATGNLDNYFAQQVDVKKIFVKHNGKLFEIPFVDGMPLELFGKLLRERKIIGKNSSAVKVAASSLLEVHDERVYLLDERELAAAQEDLESNVDSYLNEHALEIDSVLIRYGGKEFSIPFVDGMPLKIFGTLLRERKIIDRKIYPEDVAVDNGFVVRDNIIFLP